MRINLTVIKGPHKGREFSFGEHDNFIVGRAEFAHFRLPVQDKFFSRIHFMVEVNPPLCRLLDMGSTNGTSVNGQKVESAGLNDGDVIKAGKTVIRVSLQESEVQTREEPGISVVPARSAGFEHGAIIEPTPIPTIALSAPASEATPQPIVTTLVRTSPMLAADAVLCRVCGNSFRELSSTRVVNISIPLPICPICQLMIRDHPQPIAGYQIVRELGRGGMGVVYLALREASGELVALKTIQPAITGTKSEAERFLREARILGDLNHLHIVAFREMGESGGLFYFAMDFVRGSDVAVLQEMAGGPLPIQRAVDLTCQMLSALEFAHDKGVVHRDIKPANMLVEERGGNVFLRLTDFGLARCYQTSPLSGLTLQGNIGGTVAFMAPEQITHFRDAKPPVDQYAAGATLYKLLSDHLVFDLPKKIEQQLLMILQNEPVPIRTRRPEIPQDLAEVVHRSLAKDPKHRFKNVGAMRVALESFGQNR